MLHHCLLSLSVLIVIKEENVLQLSCPSDRCVEPLAIDMGELPVEDRQFGV